MHQMNDWFCAGRFCVPVEAFDTGQFGADTFGIEFDELAADVPSQ